MSSWQLQLHAQHFWLDLVGQKDLPAWWCVLHYRRKTLPWRPACLLHCQLSPQAAGQHCKRHWEHSQQQWREALQQLVLGLLPQ